MEELQNALQDLVEDSDLIMGEVETLTVRLKNGRSYEFVQSKNPYQRYGTGGEYSTGGIIILSKLNRNWVYIDNAENVEDVVEFVRAAKRLK